MRTAAIVHDGCARAVATGTRSARPCSAHEEFSATHDPNRVNTPLPFLAVRSTPGGSRRMGTCALAFVVSFGAPLFALSPAETPPARAATGHTPPRANGYFQTRPPGARL